MTPAERNPRQDLIRYAIIGLLFAPAAVAVVVLVPCMLLGWTVVRLARWGGVDLLAD